MSGYREIVLSDKDPFSRIRMLMEEKADVLICSGIQSSYKSLLEAENCKVLNGVNGPAVDALFGYMSGRLVTPNSQELPTGKSCLGQSITADLTEWTRDLFQGLGWEIEASIDNSNYPVVLVGKRLCPLCGKPVMTAISCGAHAFRVDKEIREFHSVTAGIYNARVYVHQAREDIQKTCDDYNIELLDPLAFKSAQDPLSETGGMPPLKKSVTNHPNLNLSVGKGK